MVRILTPVQGGVCRLQVVALRRGTATDRRRFEAAQAFEEGEDRRRQGLPGQALERYRVAIDLWKRLGDRKAVGLAHLRQARALANLYQYGEAIEILEQVLKDARQRRDGDQQARALRWLGSNLQAQGKTKEARWRFAQALDQLSRLQDSRGRAEVLTELGRIDVMEGRIAEAERRYQEAIELFLRLGDTVSRGKVLLNYGFLDTRIGEPEVALERFSEALSLLPESDEGDRATILAGMGTAYVRLDRDADARQAFKQALGFRAAPADARQRLYLLTELGSLELRSGNPAGALPWYRKVLQIGEATRDGAAEAAALESLAWCHWEQGELRQAGELFARSVDLARRIGYRRAEAAALSGLARVAESEGRLETARTLIFKSLAIVEDFRAGSKRLEARTAFFADNQIQFDTALDILMALEKKHPLRGYAAEAFEVSEQSRARRLLDVLQAGGMPRSSPPRVSLRQVQREVLDKETLLLQFDLGRVRSYLWVISRSSVATFPLPAREEIETLAREVHQRFAESGGSGTGSLPELKAWELSQMLLREAAHLLPQKPRLLVVAEGSLLTVPFEALPLPSSASPGAEPLVTTHEIVYAPSSSIAAWLLRRPQSKATKLVAVLADPVYSKEDPRLSEKPHLRREERVGPPQGGRNLLDGLRGLPLRHLEFTEAEARAILSRVPVEQRLGVLGFEATRELVLSGALYDFQIVHFATHGLLNPVTPDRSGIVLSQWDRAGRPREGLLSVADIRKLTLRADLVVLSACSTGLGKDVRGEGLIGLSHAFFQAGSRSTLVSLWPVRDSATAELMKLFYQGMFERDLAPAAALRQAQLALRQNPRWHRPQFWAGFVLHGGWSRAGYTKFSVRSSLR